MPADTPWLVWLISCVIIAVITSAGGWVTARATGHTEKEKTALDSWREVTERQDHELADLRARLGTTEARVNDLLDKVDDLDRLRRLYRRHTRDWRLAFPDRDAWPRADPLIADDLGDTE
ncbi:hypothetical protein [Corynebacterium variabile]|uniref:hypothetical protein n=1 Tax=Corynebacterium variabile TaxID=1727 RepID=UPI003FD04457